MESEEEVKSAISQLVQRLKSLQGSPNGPPSQSNTREDWIIDLLRDPSCVTIGMLNQLNTTKDFNDIDPYRLNVVLEAILVILAKNEGEIDWGTINTLIRKVWNAADAGEADASRNALESGEQSEPPIDVPSYSSQRYFPHQAAVPSTSSQYSSSVGGVAGPSTSFGNSHRGAATPPASTEPELDASMEDLELQQALFDQLQRPGHHREQVAGEIEREESVVSDGEKDGENEDGNGSSSSDEMIQRKFSTPKRLKRKVVAAVQGGQGEKTLSGGKNDEDEVKDPERGGIENSESDEAERRQSSVKGKNPSFAPFQSLPTQSSPPQFFSFPPFSSPAPNLDENHHSKPKKDESQISTKTDEQDSAVNTDISQGSSRQVKSQDGNGTEIVKGKNAGVEDNSKEPVEVGGLLHSD